jgi:VWFA-related protein
MRRAALVLATGAAVRLVAAAGQEPVQVFRGQVDVVSVDVSVTDRSRPVVGLRAGDFRLTDNGVPQQIEAASADGVPIDLSLVLDVSNEAFVHRRIEEFRNDAAGIAAVLRPTDQLEIVADTTDVTVLSPMHPASGSMSVSAPPAGGGTSTCDAIVMTLLRSAAPGRRHLVVAFTEAVDYLSVTRWDTVPAVAERSDALLHVVLAQTWTGGYGHGRLAIPHTAQFLVDAAERTGGSTQPLGRSVVDTVKSVIADFHRSYLLHYTPRGVQRSGWHQIAVSVTTPARKKYVVRARTGYAGGQR